MNKKVKTLVKLCVEQLSNRQKDSICALSAQYPDLFHLIVKQERKKTLYLDCIRELYCNQIQYRYPEFHLQNTSGVVAIPLLKCCLKNQSIRSEEIPHGYYLGSKHTLYY